MSLSVILTCYNETPAIFRAYEKIADMMKTSKVDYEIIIVDDGSVAPVRTALPSYFKNKEDATVVFSSQNEGRGSAVSKGIRLSQRRYAGFIDTDLEISQDYLLKLYYALVESDADVIIGKRTYCQNLNFHNVLRWYSSRIYFFLANTLLGLRFLDTETGIKIFKRASVIPILDDVKDKRWFWDTEIIAEGLKRGLSIIQAPVFVLRKSSKQSLVHVARDTARYLLAIYRYKWPKGIFNAQTRRI